MLSSQGQLAPPYLDVAVVELVHLREPLARHAVEAQVDPSETKTLKGGCTFNWLTTKCFQPSAFQPRVNLMSTCTCLTSGSALRSRMHRHAATTASSGFDIDRVVVAQAHVVPVHRVMCKYTIIPCLPCPTEPTYTSSGASSDKQEGVQVESTVISFPFSNQTLKPWVLSSRGQLAPPHRVAPACSRDSRSNIWYGPRCRDASSDNQVQVESKFLSIRLKR